jgi:small ligand-binding sensory domain FIST
MASGPRQRPLAAAPSTDPECPVMTTEVRLEAVSKRYGGVAAVDEVNLHVEAGEFLVVGQFGFSPRTTAIRTGKLYLVVAEAVLWHQVNH